MTVERKARWVKDSHKTPEQSCSTYAGVVSREIIRISLTYALLTTLLYLELISKMPIFKRQQQRRNTSFADLRLASKM